MQNANSFVHDLEFFGKVRIQVLSSQQLSVKAGFFNLGGTTVVEDRKF